MFGKQVYLLIIFLSPLGAICQPALNADYHRVKNGTFYFYPPNNPKGFTVIRKGGMQEEIDHSKGDTTFWKVNWKGERLFDIKFVRKSSPMSSDENQFYNSHTAIFEVLKCEKNYYVFKVGMDSINNANALTDTMWMKARQR